MALPPIHRIDSPPGFVSGTDSCWDWDKINAEPDTGKPSPAAMYFSGLSRYDLDTVRDYWKEGEKPVIFYLRKLSLSDYAKAKDMIVTRSDDDGNVLSVNDHEAALWVFSRGVESVAGIPALAEYELGAARKMSNQDRKRFEEQVGDVMIEVGQAVLKLMRGLTYEEGKA